MISVSEWKTRITRVQIVKPKVGGDACLVLIYPPGPELGKRWALENDELVVGRGSDCDIQIDRDSVSGDTLVCFESMNNGLLKI